ncbi:MAG TPA: hypothetical protein VOA87_17520 [Thermoanaerobaculia bacterium]|nr:hypothetical protein [Thermoanaerobaculia bacterium]
MLVRPMIDSWTPPHIERIAACERRRLAVLPVAGLSGDLHQDLGRGALAVEIAGSLLGDDARDDFLKQVRQKFLAGEPVDFVADIVKESELERVLIEELAVEESADAADTFRYRIVLCEYTEPPPPPAGGGVGADFGSELDGDLDALAQSGLNLLDLPAIAGAVPNVPDILSPLKPAAAGLKQALGGAGSLLDPLKGLLGGS